MAGNYAGPAMFTYDGSTIEVTAVLQAGPGGWSGELGSDEHGADELFADALGQFNPTPTLTLSGNAVGSVKVNGSSPGRAAVVGVGPPPF